MPTTLQRPLSANNKSLCGNNWLLKSIVIFMWQHANILSLVMSNMFFVTPPLNLLYNKWNIRFILINFRPNTVERPLRNLIFMQNELLKIMSSYIDANSVLRKIALLVGWWPLGFLNKLAVQRTCATMVTNKIRNYIPFIRGYRIQVDSPEQ